MNSQSVSSPGPKQGRLPIDRPPSYRIEDFVAGPSNAVARGLLEPVSAWDEGRIALVGPAGCGKTHLARVWAVRQDAIWVGPEMTDLTPLRGRAAVVENADSFAAHEVLFHLINMAAPASPLLLTARTAPVMWRTTVPDLRSRLNALHVVQIAPPDDVVLAGLLRKLFRERNIVPIDDVIPYLLSRLERSAPAAMRAVREIDALADAEGRNITRAFVQKFFDKENK